MYQSLIWAAVLRDQPSRLIAPGNAKGCKGLANALVDGVRRDLELSRDLFGRQELVDQSQAVDLAGGQLGDALGRYVSRVRIEAATTRVMRSVRFVQGNTHPTRHAALPKHESAINLSYPAPISQFTAGITPFSS
jgi:hypothetical protein